MFMLFPPLAYPFPVSGQSSFYLPSHLFGFTRQQKESVEGSKHFRLDLLEVDSSLLSRCLGRALNPSLPLA